ncbi:hypothetical protein B0H19DRAFT_1264908 [Mycena capillaripes]|nr:hypothetical protein B0H19DRAFT_1264908 [Mycena capillaripes]
MKIISAITTFFSHSNYGKKHLRDKWKEQEDRCGLVSFGATRFSTFADQASSVGRCLTALGTCFADGLIKLDTKATKPFQQYFINDSPAQVTFHLHLYNINMLLKPIARGLKTLESSQTNKKRSCLTHNSHRRMTTAPNLVPTIESTALPQTPADEWAQSTNHILGAHPKPSTAATPGPSEQSEGIPAPPNSKATTHHSHYPYESYESDSDSEDPDLDSPNVLPPPAVQRIRGRNASAGDAEERERDHDEGERDTFNDVPEPGRTPSPVDGFAPSPVRGTNPDADVHPSAPADAAHAEGSGGGTSDSALRDRTTANNGADGHADTDAGGEKTQKKKPKLLQRLKEMMHI